MSNLAKKLSFLAPAALIVSLPASAIPISITQTSENAGFAITEQLVEVEDGVATELEIIESWSSSEIPVVDKLVSINYNHETKLADPFEFEFKVTNNTGAAWTSYSFTFPDLGVALGDVLINWENELEDRDDLPPAFAISEIIPGTNTLRFDDGAHRAGAMVSYELFFDSVALADAGITEFTTVQAVPLPAAAWLMFGGLGMLVGFARKRKTA